MRVAWKGVDMADGVERNMWRLFVDPLKPQIRITDIKNISSDFNEGTFHLLYNPSAVYSNTYADPI
jgi:hypothetical protein